MTRTRVAMCLALAAALGCGDDGHRITGGDEGRTRILLTDAPFPYADVARVDMHIVRVEVAASADSFADQAWVQVARPERPFNLLELQDGATVALGYTDLHFGAVAAVRVVLDLGRSAVTMLDGTEASVMWGADGEVTVAVGVEQPLVQWADAAGDIVLDFDVGRSFLPGTAWFGPNPVDFVFVPWIRAVNAQASATIRGTVRAPGGDAGVADATVEARRVLGDEEPAQAVATARSAADGSYVLRFLSPGTYAIEASPPAGMEAGTGRAAQLTQLLMGDDMLVDVRLAAADSGQAQPILAIAGPNPVGLGQSVTWHATAVTGSGDSAVGVGVVWASRNPAVLGVVGNGSTAHVTGAALGSAWLVGAWGTLLDSALVAVVEDADTTGGGTGGAVATITLSPLTATAAVGDSLGFYATLRDAAGTQLFGRTVSWSVGNGTVVTIEGAFGSSVILRALAAGTTSVTAASEGKSGSATVTVQ